MASNIESITLVRRRRNPTRFQQWNGSFGCGDDMLLDLEVYDQDTDTSPLDISAAAWQMAFWRDTPHGGRGYGCDYGWPFALQGNPLQALGSIVISGVLVDGPGGRVNLTVPSATTSLMFGRYCFALQVQTLDGVSSMLEGEVSIIPGAGLSVSTYGGFTIGDSSIGGPDGIGGSLGGGTGGSGGSGSGGSGSGGTGGTGSSGTAGRLDFSKAKNSGLIGVI